MRGRAIVGTVLVLAVGSGVSVAGWLAWHPGETVALAPAAHASAPVCVVQQANLDAVLRGLPGLPQVTSNDRRDPDSLEPIRRNIVDFADGDTFVLEQQNCAIANLRLILLSPDEAPTDRQIDRFAAILARVPVWKQYFASIDAARFTRSELASEAFRSRNAAANRFSYATEALPATGEVSETVVSFQRGESTAGPYRSQLTVTIAAGG